MSPRTNRPRHADSNRIRLELLPLDRVRPRAIDWLIPRRVAFGGVTAVAGPSDADALNQCLDAARTFVARLDAAAPHAADAQRPILFIAPHTPPATVLRQRLDDAGLLAHVAIPRWDAARESMDCGSSAPALAGVRVPADPSQSGVTAAAVHKQASEPPAGVAALDALIELIERARPRMVIIHPLCELIGSNGTWKLRQAMSRLVDVADRTGAAILACVPIHRRTRSAMARLDEIAVHAMGTLLAADGETVNTDETDRTDSTDRKTLAGDEAGVRGDAVRRFFGERGGGGNAVSPLRQGFAGQAGTPQTKTAAGDLMECGGGDPALAGARLPAGPSRSGVAAATVQGEAAPADSATTARRPADDDDAPPPAAAAPDPREQRWAMHARLAAERRGRRRHGNRRR